MVKSNLRRHNFSALFTLFLVTLLVCTLRLHDLMHRLLVLCSFLSVPQVIFKIFIGYFGCAGPLSLYIGFL